MNRFTRAFVLVLALAAMLGISTASTTPAHLHLNSSGSRCDLCLAAHVSTHQIPPVHVLHAPEQSGHTAFLISFIGYEPVIGEPDCARGPPTLYS